MLNFHFADDPNRHVCEVQVTHTKMMLAREGLGGHDAYDNVRFAMELLEVLGVPPQLAAGGVGGEGTAPGTLELQMIDFEIEQYEMEEQYDNPALGDETEDLVQRWRSARVRVASLAEQMNEAVSALRALRCDSYVCLDQLEQYRGADGRFELLLSWPGAGLEPQHWRQASNPFVKRSRGVDGYEPISCPHEDHAWGGLQWDGNNAVLSGSAKDVKGGLWFYAVGSYHAWNGAIPGPKSPVYEVEFAARGRDLKWHPIMTQRISRDASAYWKHKKEPTLPLNGAAPMASNFSVLDALETFRDGASGALELKLSWPGAGLEPQHWKQTSNPYVKRTRGVDGYEPISCPHHDNNWGGLQWDGKNAVLSGSALNGSGAWFYAVGSFHEWNGAIPGPKSAVKKVELHARRPGTGEWALVMRQTWDAWPREVPLRLSADAPDAPNFAELDALESYRDGASGKLELKLSWPGAGLEPQHWKQTSNPYVKRSRGVDGYEPISCPHDAHKWGGLQWDTNNAVLSGSALDVKGGLWFYALGSFKEWNGGIPGPKSAVKKVELHARRPGTDEWALVMRQTWMPTAWPFTLEPDAPGSAASTGQMLDSGGGAGVRAPHVFRLSELEGLRQDDGKLELKLSWPSSELEPQHWKQLSNPWTKRSRGVDGYEPISCPHDAHKWGGLQWDTNNAVLSGSALDVKGGLWFYAVGSYKPWNAGIPGPSGPVHRVELHARASGAADARWQLVMRQTVPRFWPRGAEVMRNVGDETARNYAVLKKLEDYRDAATGKLELKLSWPGSELAPQHWRQTSNPYFKRTRGVDGYEPISCPHDTQKWGGLQWDTNNAVLSGSALDVKGGLWFYALGSFALWKEGIPGPTGAVKQVELHVRQPGGADTAGGSARPSWVLIMRQTIHPDEPKGGLWDKMLPVLEGYLLD